MERATLPEVQFGPIRAGNVTVLVGDLARYSEFAGKADAIIGMDLLQLSNVAIDLAPAFDLRPTPQKTYLAGGDPMAKCLVVELQVQDRPVHLLVDTGSPGILFYEERLRERVPTLRTAGSLKNATMGGRMPVKQATLPDVVFGNRTREVPVLLLPSPPPNPPRDRRNCGYLRVPGSPRALRLFWQDVVLGVSTKSPRPAEWG